MTSRTWRRPNAIELSDLVLQARAEDQVVVGNPPAVAHTHVLGLPVDAHHLARHHGDAGAQGQLGQVSAAVSVTAGCEQSVEILMILDVFAALKY